MKKKTLQTGLFSVIGVAAMLLILVAINFIAGRVKQRVDLTAEHAYTLSAGTKAILAKLDTPVQIRFYASQSAEGMPVFLKTYAQQVDDLLGEYRQNSRGLIQIQKLDPEPDSDAEDSAKLEGVEPQLLSNGERGLSRFERQPPGSERSDPVPQPGARAPPRVRHLARDRAS